jgi:aspartyl-tRNA(Asn)/glutamyl-tRNA(Gln) amidotransferase subunit C
MSVTELQIKKVCDLAKIATSDQQISDLTKKVSIVLDWVEKLNSIDTKGIEPLHNVHNAILKLNNDIINQKNDIADIFKNSPNSLYNYFCVPKVIE